MALLSREFGGRRGAGTRSEHTTAIEEREMQEEVSRVWGEPPEPHRADSGGGARWLVGEISREDRVCLSCPWGGGSLQ